MSIAGEKLYAEPERIPWDHVTTAIFAREVLAGLRTALIWVLPVWLFGC